MRLNSLADRFVISQRPARRGGSLREEKKKKIRRPAILRGRLQSRQGAKAPAILRGWPPEGRQARIRRGGQAGAKRWIQFLCVSAPLRDKKSAAADAA